MSDSIFGTVKKTSKPRKPARVSRRDETYEGWKNHATWLVALTFDNDEPLYRKRLAASGGKGFTSASVKAFVKRTRPGAYRKVNWKELAEHWS